MNKISLFISVLSVSLCAGPYAFAQDHNHRHAHNNVKKSESIPGNLWLLLGADLRNLEEAYKTGNREEAMALAKNLKDLVAELVSTPIGDDFKPHEAEQIKASFGQLENNVQMVVDVLSAEIADPVAQEEAMRNLSGALTLAKIDVPPGFVESLAGSSLRAEVLSPTMIAKDVDQEIRLRLKNSKGGKPLKPEDFDVVHTKIIHGLMIDPALNDYRHIHPVETDAPGEYIFNTKPLTDCTYRLWLDVKIKDRPQEFAVLDLPGKDACGNQAVDKTEYLKAKSEGFEAGLKIEKGTLSKGSDVTLVFDIKNDQGESLQNLEPLMGAYAHVVGFYDDYRSIAHLHPLGEEPKEETERGQAPLSFHFSPEQAGFVKLFLQVSVDGKEVYFPFGVTIAP